MLACGWLVVLVVVAAPPHVAHAGAPDGFNATAFSRFPYAKKIRAESWCLFTTPPACSAMTSGAAGDAVNTAGAPLKGCSLCLTYMIELLCTYAMETLAAQLDEAPRASSSNRGEQHAVFAHAIRQPRASSAALLNSSSPRGHRWRGRSSASR